MSRLLVCPDKIYVVSRLSQGWEDCGGSSTLFGSMSGVYMLESTSSSGPGLCLAKLLRMSMNHEDQLIHRGMTRMTRSSLNSPPAFTFVIYTWMLGSVIIYIIFGYSTLYLIWAFCSTVHFCVFHLIKSYNWKEKCCFHVQQQFNGSHTVFDWGSSLVILLFKNLLKLSLHHSDLLCPLYWNCSLPYVLINKGSS